MCASVASSQSNIAVVEIPANAQAIQCAESHLGFGYDRTAGVPNPFRAQVFGSISEGQIVIGEHQTLYVSEIDATLEGAIQQTQNRIGFDLHVPRIPLGFSGKFTQERQSAERTNQFVCAVLQMYNVDCRLKEMPSLKEDLRIHHPIHGDAVVRSGHAVTGYRFCLEISISSQETRQQMELEGGLQASFMEGLVGLGIDATRMQDNLRNKTIKHVKIIEMRGFGGYFPPTQAIADAEDFGNVVTAIEEVKKDFIQKLPTIEGWHFSLTPSVDLIGYDDVPRHPATIEAAAAATTAAQPLMLLPSEQLLLEPFSTLTYYDSFQKKMFASFSEEYKTILSGLLHGILPSIMLRRISEVFSQTSRGGGGALPNSHTLVIGDSGVGKTTLIGYLLDLDVRKQRVLGKARLVYDYAVQDSQKPPIGHFPSETKGCNRYQQFLDAAGLLDTQGIESDICNAMAIEMMTKINSVGHLIVVLPSNAFENRAAGFLKVVHTLRRVVCHFEKMDVFPSVLFVFNDKTGSDDEETIKAFIQETTHTLEQDIDREVTSPGWWNMLKAALPRRIVGGGQRGDAELPSIPRGLPDEVQRKIQENIDTIMLLDLLSQQRNFICTNFEDGSTREEILDWLRRTPRLGSSSLKMRNLVDGGYTKFVFFLSAICTYFNKFQTERQDLREHLGSIKNAIQSAQSSIALLSRELSEAERAAEAETANQEIDKLERKKIEIEKQIRVLEEEKTSLAGATDEEFLSDITQSMHPRPFWAIFDAWAPVFTFKSEGNPPLIKIEKNPESPPGDFFDENLTHQGEGVYEIKYRPGFDAWGQYEDCSAHVKLYVRKNQHPSTIARIEEIESKQHMLKTSIEDSITGLSVRIAGEKARRDNFISSVKQDKEKQIAEKRKELSQLENQQGIFEQKVINIESEFNSHKEYCSLIVDIIENLELSTLSGSPTNGLFKRFIEIFK